MTDARFVHIVDDVPELSGRAEGPVLVVALDGFLDAGNASALASAHLAGAASRAAWSRASRSTSSTTTAPGGHRSRSWRTTTPTTRRPGWWCG